MDQAFMQALQQQMPALKSQAQFNAFMASFEALRGLMNGVFAQNKEAEALYRDALDKAIDAGHKVTEITVKLEDVPEAATSREAEQFKQAPVQFTEYDTQRALLTELEGIKTVAALIDWWTANRARIDQVRSAGLRNPLLDLVREKRALLARG
jgi:hypothetical protein